MTRSELVDKIMDHIGEDGWSNNSPEDDVKMILNSIQSLGLVIGEKITYTSATIDTTNLYLVRVLS